MAEDSAGKSVSVNTKKRFNKKRKKTPNEEYNAKLLFLFFKTPLEKNFSTWGKTPGEAEHFLTV